MPRALAASRAATTLIWACLGLVLLFLYAPLVPPAIHSFEGAAGSTGLFRELRRDLRGRAPDARASDLARSWACWSP